MSCIFFTTFFSLMNISLVHAADQPATGDLWQIVLLKGERIGFGYFQQEAIVEQGTSLVRTETLAQFRFKRGGMPFLIKTVMRTVETPAGELKRLERETTNPPAQPATLTATVADSGNELEIVNTINGQRQTKRLPWKAGTKSPAWQDRMLELSPLKPEEIRSFEAFQPELLQITTVTMSARDWETPPFGVQSPRDKLLKIAIKNSYDPETPITCWMERSGTVPWLTMPLLGGEVTIQKVSRLEALKEIESGDLDLNVASSVPVPNPPRLPHQQPKLSYRVIARQGDPSRIFPAGSQQGVRKIDEQTAVIEARASSFPDARSTRSPGLEFQEPSAYIQSEDATVQKHANAAVGDEKHPSRRAKLMEAYVYRQVKAKNFSTALASAAEVARTLEGDCTESAVLLAALLRAKGIPSRVVVGLVYVERQKAFGCHMWTEAWLGDQWVGLDATIGQGGLGSGHLKMLDASFADSGPTPIAAFLPLMSSLGNLSIRVDSAD